MSRTRSIVSESYFLQKIRKKTFKIDVHIMC